MYFVRIFKSGAADYDPRQLKWAEYHCENCGKKEQINVTGNFSFDYSRPRKCSNCKSFGKEDFLKNLITKKSNLEKEKEKIQIEIENIIKEIGIAKQKVEENVSTSTTN